ncbi:hypothetical protein [Shewanella algae]|uniref:hypothetical protein n=1 Tax=Shewanella algae TaxID=38313 RepID=UPI0031F4F8AF
MKLEKALNSENSDDVEEALYADPVDDPKYIEVLIALLPLEWHKSHEDIARYLQLLKPVNAVPVLLNVAQKKFAYLEYDNSLALARKCVWAIADIGTEQSKEALKSLSVCGDTDVEGYAIKRLQSWDKESARKRV